MASRKQRRKARIRASARSSRQSAVDLVLSARRCLVEANGRKALDLLKQALNKHSAPEQLDVLFYCACVSRARNLAEKGMQTEAVAMRSRAGHYEASIQAAELSPEDLRLYVAALEPSDALAAYAAHALRGERDFVTERVLADMLVVDRCWDGLLALEPDDPFRRDAECVRSGVDAMDTGDWERAAGTLRGVGRRSPFAPWRLFCKAMLQFGEGDDESLRRTVEQIPDDFAMAGTVAAWKSLWGEGGVVPDPVRSLLGLGAGQRRALAEGLARALGRAASGPALAQAISELATVLSPERPDDAVADLLQVAGLATSGTRLSFGTVREAARLLLPQERFGPAMARMRLLIQHKFQDEADPGLALDVIRSLPDAYPNARERAIARGCVLDSLARTAFENRGRIDFSGDAWDDFGRLIGRDVEHSYWIGVDLMAASLRADPDNRDGYLFICDLVRRGAPGKGRLEPFMLRMASRFRHDPLPLLELAHDYYARNAYRKAEDALAEAVLRAPHDERIRGLQAIGFLKSASQGAKAGRSGAALADIGRAEAIARPSLAAVMWAKRILVELLSGEGKADAVLAAGLDARPPLEQLQILVLLAKDYVLNSRHKRFREEDEIEIHLALGRRRHLVDALEPDEKLSLLRPLPSEFSVLYDYLKNARFVVTSLPSVLDDLEEDSLFEAFDLMLDSSVHDAVRRDIEARLGESLPSDTRQLLRFYRAVIDLSEGHVDDPRELRQIVDLAEPPVREKLRAAAQRLSRLSRGALAEALRRFDFERLVPSPELLPSMDELLGEMPALRDLLQENPALREVLGSMRDSEQALPDMDISPLDMDLHDGLHYLANQAAAHERNPADGFSFERQLAGLHEMLAMCGWEEFSPGQLRNAVEDERSCPFVARYLDSLARQCARNDMRDTLSPPANVLLFWGSARRARGSRKR